MGEKVRTLFLLFRDTFCHTRAEEESFLKFMFLNTRGIYECAMMNQID